MKLKTINSIELKKSAKKSSSTLLQIPQNTEVKVIGKKIKYDNNTPFVKVQYNSVTGFANAKYILGLFIDSKSTGNKKYPQKATIANGDNSIKIKIPQQTQFGSFCKLHGCSVAAVTVALQLHDILLSPSGVHTFAKSFLSGYTGSKLTIYGTKRVINKKCPNKAVWKPFTGDKAAVKENIENAISKGYFVLFEQKSPIHTNIIIGRSASGKYVIATNGKVKKVTLNYLIKKALKGYKSEKKQCNWWNGRSAAGAGYVIVKR